MTVLLVAGIVAWATAAGRGGPSPAVEEIATQPGIVDLPSPGVGTAVPAGSADVPLDLVATCPTAPTESACVRWVQPGPRAWLGRTAPVVPDGTGRSIVVGAEDRVRSLDLDTGRTRWTVGVGGGAMVIQQVGADLVAVQDADGVRGLDVVDGDVRWSLAGANLLAGPPHAGPLPLAVVTTPDGVAALDPEDGTVVWRLPDAGMPATAVPIGGGQLLVGGVVVDVATGAVAWDSRRADTHTQPVAAAATRVLVLEGELPDGADLVLRAASHGQHLARLDVDPARVVGTSIVGEFVVVQTAQAMAAFRLDDGELAWRRTDRRGTLLASPPATGPYPGLPGVTVPAPGLAVRRADGTILVLDPATGAVRHRLGSPPEDRLDLGDGLTADGRVFRIDDDRLRVFDLDDGALLADVAVRTPDVVSTSPVVVLTAGRLVRLELPAAVQ